MICSQCNGSGYHDRFAGFDIPCATCAGEPANPLDAELAELAAYLKLVDSDSAAATVERARAALKAMRPDPDDWRDADPPANALTDGVPC